MDKNRKRKTIHIDQSFGATSSNEQSSSASSSTPPSHQRSPIPHSLLPSHRAVRQHLMSHSDFPRPGLPIATETRKKRKAVVAFGRGEENSSPLLRSRHRRTIFTPLYLGGPNHICSYCGARFWSEERVCGYGRTASPVYNRCCKGGSFILPPYKPPPDPLFGLLTGKDHVLSKHFFDNIRRYNSMFAMTSMGVNVINSINDGHGSYVFKISGQLCHRIGSLIPRHDAKPEYCQLYVFDTENEIKNRIAVATRSETSFQPNKAIVESLIRMLDAHNPIVQVFRTARDRSSMQPDTFDQLDDHYDHVHVFVIKSVAIKLSFASINRYQTFGPYAQFC